jgi:site-specific DNA-methyltransferase (adenine-specific)
MDQAKVAIGVFLTLQKPSRDMISEAASAGLQESPGWGKKYPRMQILTVEELLHANKHVDMPTAHGTSKRRGLSSKKGAGQQGELPL